MLVTRYFRMFHLVVLLFSLFGPFSQGLDHGWQGLSPRLHRDHGDSGPRCVLGGRVQPDLASVCQEDRLRGGERRPSLRERRKADLLQRREALVRLQGEVHQVVQQFR